MTAELTALDPTAEALEHEQSLLGSVLFGYYDLPSLTRTVSEADFYRPSHGQIWEAALRVHGRGDQVTPLTVADELGDDLFRVGGAPYLHTLLRYSSAADAGYAADKVRGASILRGVSNYGHKLLQLPGSGVEPQEMVSEIRQWCDDALSTKTGLSTAGSALESVIDIAQNGEPRAMPTPWRKLGELVEGWYPGQLITIGARPGVGKSIFLENVAHDVASRGRHVLFISLEMSETELIQRTLAHAAGVPLQRLRNGSCTEIDWARINQASPQIDALPWTIADDPSQTVEDIRANAWEARQKARRAGSELSLILLDYLGRVKPLPGPKQETRQQAVGKMTWAFKTLAREFEVPFIMAAQLNRDVTKTNRRPDLPDLREAGDIEQDSDGVIFLHKPEEESDEREFVVAKQRSGPTGVRSVYLSGHYCRLHEEG